MARHLTETEKMISNASMRAYSKGERDDDVPQNPNCIVVSDNASNSI